MRTWQQIAAAAGALLCFALGAYSLRRAVKSHAAGEFDGTENPSPDVIRRERPVLFRIVMGIHLIGGLALILFGALLILATWVAKE